MPALRFRNRKCEQIVKKTGDNAGAQCAPIIKGIPNTVKKPNVAEDASSRFDSLKQKAQCN